MPLYEYRCASCGERFEVLQRLGADGGGLVCPHCAAPEPQRVHSTFAASSGGREAATPAMAGGACCRGPGFS